jgi:integrase/recombinase XerD
MRICYCGVRFFFLHVLKRDWHTLDLVRAQSEGRVPAVLSLEEVRAILGYVRTPHNRAFPSTVYACGLRLQEAQHLEISDIDTIAPGAQWEARSAPEGGRRGGPPSTRA